MELTKELRTLVKHSVALLGEVLRRELGDPAYQQIENLRESMTHLRTSSKAEGLSQLRRDYQNLSRLKPKEQHHIAHAFTLMLELMNACENAYRSYRLNYKNQDVPQGELPNAIIYVLTAHPTEARSPQNIAIFHEIQNILESILRSGVLFTETEKNALSHSLEIAWRTSLVRRQSPKVKDEAEHVYSLLFRDDVIWSLINQQDRKVPFYARSWVGGDKDGHPGVNEKTLLESLTLSRNSFLHLIHQEFLQIRKTLNIFPSQNLQKQIGLLEKQSHGLRVLKVSDAKTVKKFKAALFSFVANYEKTVGSLHPSLKKLIQLLETFPGLVVPLELRESSDVLMSPEKDRKKLAIYKMLQMIEKLSRGGNPLCYARGFIISMTESLAHIQTAGHFQKSVFGKIPLPIIPLFEEARSLAMSDQIMTAMTQDPVLKKSATELWHGQIEMMVGYSDSAKEAGVLASRLAISDALPKLEKVCEAAKLTPIFFHGSGGSTDRGGGSIEDQTAWWPRSALRTYKVTVQGEMIERSLATPAIAKRQLETIIESAAKGLGKTFHFKMNPAVENFARRVSAKYETCITSPDFLKMVESATPYSFLSFLKIGSRPAKRSVQMSVKGLRAIPWVMCWTQTRILFPTWWGVGSAWKESDAQQKSALQKAFLTDPVFTSYVKALGFTLAKIEINIWRIYLEQSNLSKAEIEKTVQDFENELQWTTECFQEICGQKDFMWFRPWLGESISLRSPMIHPLNMLQILAEKNKDLHLLRVTVTGISSGMLTTG